MGVYEIGSELWMRERIERGLDPAESDRPKDHRLLCFGLDLHPTAVQPSPERGAREQPVVPEP